MLFGSIWGSFLGQAFLLLLLQYNTTLSRGRGPDFFLQSGPFHNFHKFFHELTWSQNLRKFKVNLRKIKSVVIWFSINFLKTFGAHLACLSVVIPKFWHSINWEKLVQPINIILCNTLFCSAKGNFIWKIVNFKFQVRIITLGMVSWCSVN